MSELRELMEEFWICKDTDKEKYYRVRHGIPGFQRLIRDQLGWKLIHTENLLKLEKIPAHAESFMGITEFHQILDYCIFCGMLIYLEDMEDGEQFLLSELISFVEAILKDRMPVDWTSYSQRKSLVRVLQFMEKKRMILVYEGSTEGFSQEQNQEVLYQNTGYARYFAVNFPVDISGVEHYTDFEAMETQEVDENRGSARIHRVYRQLVTSPAMYWDSTEDPDSLYLKNQRSWIRRYLNEHLGGSLDIHKNAAFWMVSQDDPYGRVHPRDAALPEIVLIVCARIREKEGRGRWKRDYREIITVPKEHMRKLIRECRDRWQEAWSKEYQEMDEDKLMSTVMGYMKEWMLLRERGADVEIMPAAAKICGEYPEDFMPNERNR